MCSLKVELLDGTSLYGHDKEYVTTILSNTKKYYEISDLERFCEYIPDNAVIYDIGANIGNHSLYFSKYTNPKHIISIEPIEQNFELLKANLLTNDCKNAIAIHAAVGEKDGKVNSILDSSNMGACKVFIDDSGLIQMISLDNSGFARPDFIKIDVEGFELSVLKGMKQILLNEHPVLWIEIKENFFDIDEYLNQFKYKLIDRTNYNFIYMKMSVESPAEIEMDNLFKRNINEEYSSLIQKNWKLNKIISTQNTKLIEINQKNSINLESLDSIHEKLDEILKKSNEETEVTQGLEELSNRKSLIIDNLEKEIIEYEQRLKEYSQKMQHMKETIEKKNQELVSCLNSEEEALTKLKASILAQNSLSAKLYKMTRNFELLRNSKLGRLTAKYWYLRGRITKDF
ncbi:FkbM family methyltransferase [Paenibacillus chungangensis]|uniref:FkbM family methyltransferase n=1 Tax=Paenibacillus chungangensis TaxID=696535 RepID=A0ABW3HW95_9BACL